MLIIQFHIWRLWKKAYHTIFIRKLKTVLREILREKLHDFNSVQKNASHITFIYENYIICIFLSKNKFEEKNY